MDMIRRSYMFITNRSERVIAIPRLTYQLKPNSMEFFIFWHGHKDLLEVKLEFFSASFLLICNKSSTNVELLLLSVFC